MSSATIEKPAKEQTSEEIFGISPQPGDTCPMINEALDEICKIERKIRGYERAGESELRDMLSDVEHGLGVLKGYSETGLLEDIRRNVTSIRHWGKEWKDLAKEFSERIEELEREKHE